MNCIMPALRMGLIVCVALLTAHCTSSPPGAVDATWTGAAGNYDFGTKGNWNPPAVPTGTATIALPDQTGVFVNQSLGLEAVKLTGNMSLTVMPKVAVTTKSGLTLCCGSAKLNLSDSEITGDVASGSASTVTENQVSGAGLRQHPSFRAAASAPAAHRRH